MALNPERLTAKIYDAVGEYSRLGRVAHEQVREHWVQMCAQSASLSFLPDVVVSYMLPCPVMGDWARSFEQVPVVAQAHPYRVGAVDGSQIYPDHHEGVPFFLIHTATVLFEYGVVSAESTFVSTSDFSVHSVHDGGGYLLSPVSLVDCMRTERELRAGILCARCDVPLFFDGALIFWHLTSRGAQTDPFFRVYCSILDTCVRDRIPTAWYTSLPQGRDFVNLVRAFFDDALGDAYKTVVDIDLLDGWLLPRHRTGLFFSGAQIADHYPDQLRPAFFYINTGDEIARVEVPAWIARETGLCDSIAAVLLDQCDKGQGYPICLAEAHEHAVVRSADRDLFFTYVRKAFEEKGQVTTAISCKSLHKRRAGF